MSGSVALNLSGSLEKDLIKTTVHATEALKRNLAYPVDLSHTKNICAMKKKESAEQRFLTWFQLCHKPLKWSATLAVSPSFWGEGLHTIPQSSIVQSD